ncbi:MAG: hypothetical protein VSS75_008390 [Candidatus Parabeggiatoa sp.]|nr:hypothetical protein [Candidatus Parabeggiatoa sp.]
MIYMKKRMTIHTLKTTLSIFCTVSFLSGCLATQEVKVDAEPSSVTNGAQPLLTSGESLPSRIRVQSVTQLQPREKRESNTQLQSKEQLQLMYMLYLKREGYLPEIDSDGDIKFKKEGYTYLIDVRAQADDPQYFRIIRPNLWSIDNDIERLEVLVAADYVNSDIKVVKLYTVKDHVWATVEIFISNQEDFKTIFSRLMSVLSGGVENFATKMREIRKEKI